MPRSTRSTPPTPVQTRTSPAPELSSARRPPCASRSQLGGCARRTSDSGARCGPLERAASANRLRTSAPLPASRARSEREGGPEQQAVAERGEAGELERQDQLLRRLRRHGDQAGRQRQQQHEEGEAAPAGRTARRSRRSRTARSRNTQNSTRDGRSPISTASVRLPAALSGSTSRRLLTISTAQAIRPMPTPPSQLSMLTVPACTSVVPSVATRPKKTKTNSSPSP